MIQPTVGFSIGEPRNANKFETCGRKESKILRGPMPKDRGWRFGKPANQENGHRRFDAGFNFPKPLPSNKTCFPQAGSMSTAAPAILSRTDGILRSPLACAFPPPFFPMALCLPLAFTPAPSTIRLMRSTSSLICSDRAAISSKTTRAGQPSNSPCKNDQRTHQHEYDFRVHHSHRSALSRFPHDMIP